MQKTLARIDTSKLTEQEIDAFRPGLEAMQAYAERHQITASVGDVKHKRSGPVVSCTVVGGGGDDALEDAFEEAMERTERERNG